MKPMPPNDSGHRYKWILKSSRASLPIIFAIFCAVVLMQFREGAAAQPLPPGSPTPTPPGRDFDPGLESPQSRQPAGVVDAGGPLLSEARYRFAPGIDTEEINDWLLPINPALEGCQVHVDGLNLSLADGLRRIAYDTGVNPRVMLTLAELDLQALSNHGFDCKRMVAYGETLAERARRMENSSSIFLTGTPADAGLAAAEAVMQRVDRIPTHVSMAIAEAAAGAKPGDPQSYERDFFRVYAAYFGDPVTAPDYLTETLAQAGAVDFVFPFDKYSPARYYTGGPHGGLNITPCAAIAVADASGLDFSGEPYTWYNSGTAYTSAGVNLIADGVVVGLKTNGNTTGGKWVAVRHSNDIVSMYWHLKSIDPMIQSHYQPGVEDLYLPKGIYLGERGDTGCSASSPACPPHWHLELRIGGWDYNDWIGDGGNLGDPVSWDGQVIDGWRVFSELYPGGLAVNYNGSVVRPDFVGPPSLRTIWTSNCGNVTAQVHPSFNQNYEVNTELTRFAFETHLTPLESSSPGG